MSGVLGVGEHALEVVVVAHRVDPGLSLNQPPTEAQHVLEDLQLLCHATQIVVQVKFLTYFYYIFSVQ